MEHVGKWAAGMAVAALLAGGSAGIWLGKDAGTATAAAAVAVEAAANVELRDIAGHWAETAIRGAVGKRYVDGYQDGSFLPDRQISRAEFVKMAAAALKLSVAESAGGSDWYQVYVNAAVGAGVHQWSDFTSGDWNTPMKRSEMARMAVRAAGQDTEDDLEWMYLATKAGLIQGVDATGSLDVDGTTTRGQAVTIIERILAVKEGRGEEIAAQADKHAVNRAAVLWRKTNIFEVMPEFFGSKVITPWDINKLVVDTPDGFYKGEVEKIIAIDFGDPNDPHRNILGNIEEVKWYVGGRNHFSVVNYPDTYGIVAFSSFEYSSDSTKYGSRGPTFYINGLVGGNDVEMSKTGVLTSFAPLEVPKGVSAAGFIIPKHGQVIRNNMLSVEVKAPAIPPNNPQYRDVVTVQAPNIVE